MSGSTDLNRETLSLELSNTSSGDQTTATTSSTIPDEATTAQSSAVVRVALQGQGRQTHDFDQRLKALEAQIQEQKIIHPRLTTQMSTMLQFRQHARMSAGHRCRPPVGNQEAGSLATTPEGGCIPAFSINFQSSATDDDIRNLTVKIATYEQIFSKHFATHEQRERIVGKANDFDKNNDGELDFEEFQAMKEALKKGKDNEDIYRGRIECFVAVLFRRSP